MPLARQLASRYRHSGEPVEDLDPGRGVGLLKAIDRFEPERGSGFTATRLPTILGELEAPLPRQGLGAPRAARHPGAAPVLKVNEALGTLPAKLGRAPATA